MPTATTSSVTRRWPFLSLAAAAFALLMTVGPIIATSGVDAGGSEDRYAGQNVGMLAARQAAVVVPGPAPLAVPAFVPGAPAALPTGASEPTEVTPSAPEPRSGEPPAAPEEEVEEAEAPPEPADGGAIALRLTLEPPKLGDGDEAVWEITVANDGHEYLWGVYAYLEGFGRVDCEDRQLDVGGQTTCRAVQKVWMGEQEGLAWATAWTASRMVEAETRIVYTVER